MIKNLVRRIRGTAQIDPAEYSVITSPDRLRSLSFALAGCAYMLRHQKNTRIQAAATVAAVGAGLWLRVDRRDWAILVLAIACVWVTEFVNAAVEAVVNTWVADIHPMAQVAKDVAAAAVLIAAIAALLIGALILGPPLADRLVSQAAAR